MIIEIQNEENAEQTKSYMLVVKKLIKASFIDRTQTKK